MPRSELRTPQALTVFLCSTYGDLAPFRETVLAQIERLRMRYGTMEFFGARGSQAIETCLEEVRRSDLVVVLVGHRYGSRVPPDLAISFTEAEYQEAHRLGRECLVYFLSDEAAVLGHHVEKDPDNLRQLLEFKATLQNRHTLVTFRTTEDLAAHLARDLERATEALFETSWSGRLRDALVGTEGEEAGRARWQSFLNAFPEAYQQRTPVAAALAEMPVITGVLESGELDVRIVQDETEEPTHCHFRTFELALPSLLTDYLPIFDNLGFQAIRENLWEVRPQGAANPVWVRDFSLRTRGERVNLESRGPQLRDVFLKVWRGQLDNDGFNRLVLAAGLDDRQVELLRACARYLRQTRIVFSLSTLAATLVDVPEASRLLVRLFSARFDPVGSEDAREVEARLREVIDQVTSLDEDRILRRFQNLIHSMVRTNYFQRTAQGSPKPYLALKLDCRRLVDLPRPRPAVEIYVYAPHVEAVHLRGGRVARGGVRWSDRRDDFRTEILGLLRAQVGKNAGIVPTGAKGGFVLARPPAAEGREAYWQAGIEAYRTMVRGLLDVTDNLVAGRVVPPADTVRHDGDDPYLVMAADKGTATFSDIANQVAGEYGFWLGDAFAAGGSVGYDHKAMGITARGAWEAVKAHFRQLGRDVQKQEFTAVGCGDMSGDVFGNGALLSRKMRLIAAFNHMHVFIDPDPDPEVSWRERRRLFELPRSTWEDYDRRLLSAGGGIFSRQAKTIPLSPEIRQVLGLRGREVTPGELIRAILRAKVDLLWLGGIGTYVKAGTETHAEIGDRFNDELRIDAEQLRCRVVGEGANLGFTQAARVEYALSGGLINTDFVDNSAGVRTSDHEVNLKIVLDAAVAAGELSREGRLELLAGMSEAVAAAVLRQNYLEVQGLTVEHALGPAGLEAQERLLRDLERAGLVSRDLDRLPDAETFEERRKGQLGLTRPELAILGSNAKVSLFFQLFEVVDDEAMTDPLLAGELAGYFPPPVRERFLPAISRHLLRREVVIASVTNQLVDRMGPTFVSRLGEEIGASKRKGGTLEVARSFLAAKNLHDAENLWRQIEELDGRVAGSVQVEMLLAVRTLLAGTCRWFLRLPFGRARSAWARLEDLQPGLQTLAKRLEECLPSNQRTELRRHRERLVRQGVPEPLARRLAGLEAMAAAPDLVSMARELAVEVETVATVYFRLASRLRLLRLQALAGRLTGISEGSRWQKVALGRALDDLKRHLLRLTRQALELGQGSPASRVSLLLGRNAAKAPDDFLAAIDDPAARDPFLLFVAERWLRKLAGGITQPSFPAETKSPDLR